MIEKEEVNQLYNQFYKEMYNYILKNVKKPKAAKEITEDTFIEAFITIEELKNQEQFLEDIKKIADNYCKLYWIKNAKASKKNKKWVKILRRTITIVSVVIATVSIISEVNDAADPNTINWFKYASQKRMMQGLGFEGIKEEDFDLHALAHICEGGVSYGYIDVLDVGTDAENYRINMGIDSIGYVVDGMVTATDNPEEDLFAAWIEVVSEEYTGQIIEEMKRNLKNEEWSYLDPSDWETVVKWDKIPIEEFTFCTDGEYIFVYYTTDEKVEQYIRKTPEQMEKRFHELVSIKRFHF